MTCCLGQPMALRYARDYATGERLRAWVCARCGRQTGWEAA